MSDQTPEEIRKDIEQTREELGDTVEALGAKSDVKGRAQAKVEDIRDRVTPSGEGGAGAALAQGGRTVKRNPLPLAVAGALALGFVIGRWGRG